jgi:hypothetical protein
MSKELTRITAALFLTACLATLASAQKNGPKVEVKRADKHDVSVPLRDLPASVPEDENAPKREHPVKPIPIAKQKGTDADAVAAQNVQASVSPFLAATIGAGFDGVGIPNYGVNAAPPDTNGAVGPLHYVQWVNEGFAVFDKVTGGMLPGFPKNGNTIWAGFGGGCETNNDGDPIVKYDRAADRWVLTQFSVSTTPYTQCVAVSTTPDPTGSYNRYSFSYGTQFNDYPKVGVWSDAYYTTYNMFANGQTFSGGWVCAWDRAKMLVGAAATQQCFNLGTSFGGLLPSDIDGANAPPAGSPNYVMNFGSNALNLWKFHVDWVNSANSSISTRVSLPVNAFTTACSGGACVTQPSTAQKLDSLADRLMYRLAYRHFVNLDGTTNHESLVVNHSVNVGATRKTQHAGVRWYELRVTNGTPSVFQQGTFAPDNDHRWMGSAAMDKMGNIGLGYSRSSASFTPSVFFTGRNASDPAGTMQAETSLFNGGGSQLSNLNRWGDYSTLSVDPVDDCTFWYTTEYLKSSGTFNWSTRIGKIKFSNCL